LFIAVENPDAAERFLAALQLSFRTLAQWPEIGPRYQSNRAELAGCASGRCAASRII